MSYMTVEQKKKLEGVLEDLESRLSALENMLTVKDAEVPVEVPKLQTSSPSSVRNYASRNPYKKK